MKQQVARSGFSETAYTYLYDNFVSYGASSGFSADVMTAAISRDQITADMESAVTRLYDGDTALDSRDSIQTATYDALLANLNARGVDVTSDVESAVAIVADACRQDYSNYVAIPLASQLYTIIEKFDRIVPISVAAMALVCAVSIFLMLRLAGTPRFGVRCLTYAFTASAVLCSIRGHRACACHAPEQSEPQPRLGQAADHHLCPESFRPFRPVRPDLRCPCRDPAGADLHRRKPHQTPSKHLIGGYAWKTKSMKPLTF